MSLTAARAARDMLARIQFVADKGKERVQVAVLTGYDAQREQLRRTLDAESIPNVAWDSYTFDEFQGREADIAIVSLTRSNDHGAWGFSTTHVGSTSQSAGVGSASLSSETLLSADLSPGGAHPHSARLCRAPVRLPHHGRGCLTMTAATEERPPIPTNAFEAAEEVARQYAHRRREFTLIGYRKSPFRSGD